MAGLPDECFKLVGPPISGRFKLRFDIDGVDSKTAAQRCTKYLQTVNWKTDGEWPVHTIQGPLERTQLFFQADESARQKVLGSYGRAFARAIKETLQCRCFVETQTGDVLYQWVAIANFQPIDTTKAVFSWDLEGARKVGWTQADMDLVDTRFKAITDQWQSR